MPIPVTTVTEKLHLYMSLFQSSIECLAQFGGLSYISFKDSSKLLPQYNLL